MRGLCCGLVLTGEWLALPRPSPTAGASLRPPGAPGQLRVLWACTRPTCWPAVLPTTRHFWATRTSAAGQSARCPQLSIPCPSPQRQAGPRAAGTGPRGQRLCVCVPVHECTGCVHVCVCVCRLGHQQGERAALWEPGVQMLPRGPACSWALGCALRACSPLPADEHTSAPPGQGEPPGALHGRLPGPPKEAGGPHGLLVPARL